MRAVIVGAGQMGRWFADVTAGWLDPSFVDADPDRAAAAAADTDADWIQAADVNSVPIIVTAVPLTATADVLREFGPLATDAVIDLSGSMSGPMTALQDTVPDREQLCLHPLFAPENAPGTVAVVTDKEGPIGADLRRTLDRQGYTLLDTTPERHDEAMKSVQAASHAAILAYALAAEPVDPRFHTPVSKGITELVEMVVNGNPRVYGDIQSTFDGADDVAREAAQIANSDAEAFIEYYRTAADRWSTADQSES